MYLLRRRSGARLGDGPSAVVWSLAESWLEVASYLDRVPLVMDTPVYRVPLQFGQFMMTLLWSDGGLLAQRARRRDACVETLVQQARALIMSGTHGHVFLELCCASDSELAAAVVEHSVAIGVTSSEDLQLASARRVLHRLLRICKAYDAVVDIWVSIPCTAGMPFRRINEKLGAETGDLALTCKLADAAVGLCRHAVRIGGGFSWEWSNGNELWDLVVVRDLFARCGTSSCLVSTAAVGQQFVDREVGVFYVKKRWKIVTTRPMLVEVMAPYASVPEHLVPADFRPCSGKVCADSAFYTPLFAELVWRALRTVVVMPARIRADPVPEGCLPAGKPNLPLWCAMVTRTVSLKSDKRPGARGEGGSGKGGCLSRRARQAGPLEGPPVVRVDAGRRVLRSACRTRVRDIGCEVR